MQKGANDMANVKVRLMDKDEDYKKMGTKKVQLKPGKKL